MVYKNLVQLYVVSEHQKISPKIRKKRSQE